MGGGILMNEMPPLYYIVWKEGNQYVSQCLNVDVASCGETKDEAVKNLNEALELYFEDQDGVAPERVEDPEIIPASFMPLTA
jgi:predicted RNase H-like HicB family nuclease